MATPHGRETLPPSRRQYVPQPVPGWSDFMHPRTVETPPIGAHWLHEVKQDGYRLQLRVADGVATVFSRRGHDWTDKLPELAKTASTLRDCILDGELCRLDADGRAHFSGLRAAIGKGDTAGLVFYAFDLLWRGQDNLRIWPLLDRKQALEGLLADADLDARIRYLAPIAASGGSALFQVACRADFEGIVSKRRDSKYVSGRSDLWVKSVCRRAQEFVIGGWEQEAGRRFKGVLVGVYGRRGFTYVGTLERGFSAEPRLARLLKPLETDTNPFKAGDPPRAHIHWVRPELVARVEFRQWTDSGKIRHASFRGLRDDKDPQEVVREEPTEVL